MFSGDIFRLLSLICGLDPFVGIHGLNDIGESVLHYNKLDFLVIRLRTEDDSRLVSHTTLDASILGTLSPTWSLSRIFIKNLLGVFEVCGFLDYGAIINCCIISLTIGGCDL